MLKKIKNKPLAAILVYSFFGLLALLFLSRFWLPAGLTLGGHDSGLPLAAKDFLTSRFFAWNKNIGLGVDNSYLFGSITLHFIDYLSALVAHVPYAGNWFNVFFWFSLLFVCAVIFAFSLRNVLGIYFAFIFPPLFIFNFYLAQSFFILERAKYSVLAGTLLFLTIVFKLLNKKISVFLAAVLTALVFLFLNGGSLLGLSLYGNLFVVALSLTVFYLFLGFLKKDFSNLVRLIKFFVLSAFFWLLLNSYQLVPYLPNLFYKEYLGHLGSGDIFQSLRWVNYISQDTSLINLLKMQGVPNWYANYGMANPGHPYSALYLQNFFYILISLVLPALAFSSWFLARGKEQKLMTLFFLVVVLVSLPFAAGTHPPFGFFYEFLYRKFPGFFIFRNPFYKFGGAFFFGMSVLISSFFSFLFSRFSRKYFALFFSLLVLIGWFVYHGSLFLPQKIFTWKQGYSTRFKVPNYVWDFYDWNKNKNTSEDRILFLPDSDSSDLAEGYEWGYWSLSSLAYALSSIPAVINSGVLTAEERAVVKKIYSTLENQYFDEAAFLASKLNIKYFLLRKDILGKDQVYKFEKILPLFPGIQKTESFGPWDLYEIRGSYRPLVFGLTALSSIEKESFYLSYEFVPDKDVVIGLVDPSSTGLGRFINQKIESYSCQSCLLEKIQPGVEFPPVQVLPNSPLYFIKEAREKKLLESSPDDTTLILNYLAVTLRRISEIRSMVFLRVGQRFLLESINTTNLYLTSLNDLLASHPEFRRNYFLAQRVLNVATPVLNEYYRFVLTDAFGRSDRDAMEAIYTQTRLLKKISDYYLPLMPSYEYLRNNKTFFLGKAKEVYLDSLSLPKDQDGRVSLPIGVKIVDPAARWLKIELPEDLKETGELKMEFNFPNVLGSFSKSTEIFPGGQYGCVSGRISDFKLNKSYEVIVIPASKSQRLSLYNGSFNKLVDIYPIEVSIPFRYVYEPSLRVSDETLFVCTEDRDIPALNSLEVYELVSPSLEAVTDFAIDTLVTPEIKYQKLSPTRFLISADSKNPFILAFGQRYSPFWKLSSLASGEEKGHLLLNGLINSWVIDRTGHGQWILEYMPQRLFYLGIAITLTSLLAITIFLIISVKKKRDG